MPHMVDPTKCGRHHGGECQHVDALGRCGYDAHVVVKITSGESTFYTRRCLYHYVALENVLRNNPNIKIIDAQIIPRERAYVTTAIGATLKKPRQKMTGRWKKGKHLNRDTGEWE